MVKAPKLSRLKIIGGDLRRRWIEFPDTQEIRPTPNRVRETLFNWLMEIVPGARVLDAFSGSGALAFEALSRGAAKVVAVEKNPAFAEQIRKNALKFGLSAKVFEVISGDFFPQTDPSEFLSRAPFDLVFLDPPFHQNFLPKALTLLEQNALLAKAHYIYFEVEKAFDFALLPARVEILKNQTAGQVKYGLCKLPF